MMTDDWAKDVLMPLGTTRLRSEETNYFEISCSGGKARNNYGKIIYTDSSESVYYVNKKTGQIATLKSDAENWK